MQNKIQHISVSDLNLLLEKDPKICLIDVREQDEWDNLHIPGALHLPKDKVPDEIERLVPDKNTPVYLYCHAGRRSLMAAECLESLGYQQIYSMDGGISEWAMFGYVVESV